MPAVFASGAEEHFSPLYDLNRDAYNAPVSPTTAPTLGMTYAVSWREAADADQVRRMRERHDRGYSGNIPRAVDADLLSFGLDHGLDTYANHLKLALRRSFWAGIVSQS